MNNTYEARLERLKDELTRPTVAEIMQMHKENRELHHARPFDDKDYVIDEVPAQHLPHADILSKKATTIKMATEEITTQMPMIEKSSDAERYLFIGKFYFPYCVTNHSFPNGPFSHTCIRSHTISFKILFNYIKLLTQFYTHPHS